MGTKKDQAHELVKAAAKGATAAGVASGGSITAMGIGALAGTAGQIASATLDQIREGIARSRGVEGPLGEATLVELEERGPELEAKLARLLEVAGDDAGKRARAVASFEAMIHAWMKASRRAADDRKRRILLAALVSGLDEDAYREGLALTILERLERLDYGAVRLLARLGAFHAGDTFSHQLVARETALSSFYLKQLREQDLLSEAPTTLAPTPFGVAALRFVREELQNHMREEGVEG